MQSSRRVLRISFTSSLADDMTHSPVRFGVLGTGRITRRIIADLQSTPGATVFAIASRSEERARWHADSHGIPVGVEGYRALLSRDDVDAVYIALPPSMHHEWTLAACESGKHVLCEKPVALSADQVREMIAAVNRAGVRFLDATAWLHHERTDQFRQWLTTVGPAEESVEAAAKKDDLFGDDEDDAAAIPFRLGPLRHLSASVSFPNPFLDGDHRLHADLGGGALLDLGWYSAGLVRFASGRLPDEVGSHPALWEIPVHTWVVPPDDRSESYGWRKSPTNCASSGRSRPKRSITIRHTRL